MRARDEATGRLWWQRRFTSGPRDLLGALPISTKRGAGFVVTDFSDPSWFVTAAASITLRGRWLLMTAQDARSGEVLMATVHARGLPVQAADWPLAWGTSRRGQRLCVLSDGPFRLVLKAPAGTHVRFARATSPRARIAFTSSEDATVARQDSLSRGAREFLYYGGLVSAAAAWEGTATTCLGPSRPTAAQLPECATVPVISGGGGTGVFVDEVFQPGSGPVGDVVGTLVLGTATTGRPGLCRMSALIDVGPRAA